MTALEAKITAPALGPVATALINTPAKLDLESAYVAAYTISHRSQVPLVVGCGFDPPVGAGYNVVKVTPSVYGFPADTLLVAKPGPDGMTTIAKLSKTATSQDICNCLIGAGCTCGVNCQCGTSAVSYQQPMMGQPIWGEGSNIFYSPPARRGFGGRFGAPVFMGGSMCGPGGCR